jgi:ATP-dependent Clp protease adaptor protein ClpS
MIKTKSQKKSILKEKLTEPFALIVHNDDYNSFDHVINCLISICGHTYQQASQCANIVHYVGMCDVKRGDYESLTKIKEKLISKKLSCTVESI